MKRKNFLFVVLLLTTFCLSTHSQTQVADTSIVQSLQRVTNGARVRLFQDARLVDRLARRQGTVALSGTTLKDQNYITVRGYRIQVFSDNNQRRSKDEANQKAAMIKGVDPGLATYITFTSPFWRLRVGDFRSFEEANLKLIELKSAFPQFHEMRVVKDVIRLPQ
ncbi:SPOR domain-containing protein [Coprobacter sp.]